jgi:uridine phosphorylase
MSILKNQFPILEFDTEKNAIINPNRNNLYHFPKKAVFPFLSEETEKYALEHSCKKIGEFQSITKIYPVYETVHNNQTIAFCQAPMGAAAAVQLMDFLIGCGVKEIISCGTCGALHDFDENQFLVPIKALRDEGTSYHYLSPSRWIEIEEKATLAIRKALIQNRLSYIPVKTWTTDGFYRETRDLVLYRKEEGCTVVDMECSALAACARFRGAVFGQILFTADTLAKIDHHEERNWGMSSYSLALKLALDSVSIL